MRAPACVGGEGAALLAAVGDATASEGAGEGHAAALALARRVAGGEAAEGAPGVGLAQARRELLALAGLRPPQLRARGARAPARVPSGRYARLAPLSSARLAALQRRVRRDVAAEAALRDAATTAPNRLGDWRAATLHDAAAAKAVAYARRSGGGEFVLRREMAQPAAGNQLMVWATPDARAGVAFTGANRDLAYRARSSFQYAKELFLLQGQLAAARSDKIARRHTFLYEVLKHRLAVTEAAVASRKRAKLHGEAVQKWHSTMQNRKGRAERARIQALRDDDYDAYIKLVKDAKNERLKELIGKTDDVLEQLGDMVQMQRNAAKEAGDAGDGDMEVDGAGAQGAALDPGATGLKRFEAAVHAVNEEIEQQPAVLEGGNLRDYQMKGLKWMVSLYNNSMSGILADEMGLGKTIQAISLIAYLQESKGVPGPHLIIAPKAVCPNWRNEFERWLPECEIILYDGNGWERRALRDQVLRGKFQVIITHYDLVMRDKATLTKPNWHYLIIDEGHRLKNHESVLARCLGQHYRSRQRLLLTGTPIQNNLNELWSLLNFILPHVFKSSASFDEWFGTIGGTANATDGDLMVQEEEELLIIQRLHQVIRPFILRRKKSEVAKELPAKEQKVLHCDMSAWQKHYYKQIVESASIGGETGRSRALANSAMQLRKCCNHPYLFLDAYMPLDARERVRAAGKFDLLDHLLPKLKASGHRILLFSQMTKMLDMLEDWLTQLGFVFMRLDGTTKTEDRDVLLRDFNAPDSPYFIFLLSTRAGGLGLNLQTADTVIMFDSDWNPQADSQAEDRAHRIGQKSQVRVFVLVTMGTIEEEIQKRAQSKRGLDGKVIQAGMFNNQSTVNERREMLSEVMTRGYNEVGRNIPTLPEINQLAARSEEELELFERMDAERLAKEGEGVSRLMEDHELPEWVTAVEEPKEDEPEELTINAAGKSVRKRKEVVYKDVLTDRQFDMLVDHDDGATRLENFTAKKVAMHLGQRPDGDSDADVANGEEAGGGGGGDVKRQRT